MSLSYTTNPYGKLGNLASSKIVTFSGRYSCVVGKNSSGKTSLLESCFSVEYVNSQNKKKPNACYIPADRNSVSGNISPSPDLESFYNSMSFPRRFTYHRDGHTKNEWSELPKLILGTGKSEENMDRLKQYLLELGLPPVYTESGITQFGNFDVYLSSSGFREIFFVLAALSNPMFNVIFIDEPERSLEPALQKKLKLLFEKVLSERETLHIVVATHSHVFLDRKTSKNNFRPEFDENEQSIFVPIDSMNELYKLNFKLLGNSLEDLFLPENYILVEGSSDQKILETILIIKNVTNITVLSCKGIMKTNNFRTAFESLFLPLFVGATGSYKERLVLLVDKPNAGQVSEQALVNQFEESLLVGRTFVLDEFSIEEYIPEDLYRLAGRNKNDDLETINKLKGDSENLGILKAEITSAISQVLNAENINKLPIILKAVDKAVELSKN